ncbi:MAG: aromatic ring-hydroxylating dioxygenase subunit alpha [Acidimicrobiaceae bacterium]|nr:aromatic ring-hydroxylating dioxygenase subunit alpha [Acidimicrobiaceae bacterium]
MTAIDVSPADLAAAREPIATATTLPPSFYTDQAVYDEIVDRVFRHSWLPVAHVSQLAHPGDYVALEMAGEPIVATVDRDGEMHVLSNVCRHRWASIVEGRGSAPALQCPYHLWTYSLDGRLSGAPRMDRVDFDKSGCRLPEYRHEVWNGFVFMTFDPGIEPLAPQIAGLDAMVSSWRLDELVVSATLSETADWSWNAMVDNWAENYHVTSVHPDSLEQMTPASLTEPIDNRGEPWCYARIGNTPEYQATIDRPISTLDTDQTTYSAAGVVFPLLCFFTFPDMAAWLHVRPTRRVDELDIELFLLVEPELAESEHIEEIREAQLKLGRSVWEQDAEMCRRSYAGLRSASARPARLSHLELSVWQTQNWLLDALGLD